VIRRGAGKLREKIEVQSSTVSQDTEGGVTLTWATIAGGRVWAAVEPLSGNEQMLAQQVNAGLSHRVRIRYMPITTKHRISYRSRILDINAIVNVDERREQLELLCTEAV
jgi:SPP1 family predicted phage head-tail adaptor